MESEEIHHVCEIEKFSSSNPTGSETLRVNRRRFGSASYICGCCNKHFVTICTLHEHLETGSGSGSYHYDHLLRTAFPKYETQCSSTQTETGRQGDKTSHRLRQSKRKSNTDNDTKAMILKQKRPQSKRLKRKRKAKYKDDSDGDISEDFDNQRTNINDSAAYNLRTNGRRVSFLRNQPSSDENDGEDFVENKDDVKEKSLDYVSVKVETTKEEHAIDDSFPDDYMPVDTAEDSAMLTFNCPADRDADDGNVIKDETESHSRGSDRGNDNEFNIDNDTDVEDVAEDQADDIDDYENNRSGKKARSRKGRQRKQDLRIREDPDKQEEDVEFESGEETNKDGQGRDGRSGKKKSYNPRLCLCYICGVPVNGSRVKYNEHIAIHIGDECFICSQCPRRFPTKSQLRVHEKRHQEYRTHQCHICPARLNTMEALKCHIRIHTDERPFKCPHCPGAFRQHSNLNMHVNRVHLKIKKFKCPQCDSMFSTRWTLQQHVMTHNPGQLQCEVCGRKFNAINSKRRHMQQHSGRRTHFCHICERGFIQRISYVTHMGKHHGMGKEEVARIEKERKNTTSSWDEAVPPPDTQTAD